MSAAVRSPRSQRWVALGAALLGLAAGGTGCGAATTLGVAGFKAEVAGLTPRLRALEDAVDRSVASDSTPAATLARRANALAVEAAQAETAVGAEAVPPRYNTRARDVRSALGSLADDLDRLSTAAGQRPPAATAAARTAVRRDDAVLAATQAGLARALGLRPS